ncbi:unnamed protein product [Paramecium pentaurelia]|uniref:Uncharacterized protein n=1 Tax=Paramecium pentaurelia TaxID=43138 RepID=A0A8S1W9S6_9CILI|nr:unnamed protein product [Paramecium pentaurelia]
MKLVFLQAEQKFKFMKSSSKRLCIEYEIQQNSFFFLEFRKKLKDLQSNLDKIPISNVSSNSKKQPPSPIKGNSRLLEAEDTQLIILDNIRNQKEKLLKAVEDELFIILNHNRLKQSKLESK